MKRILNMYFTECQRCIMPASIPSVKLDEHGICNYCHMHDSLDKQYPIDYGQIEKIGAEIRKNAKGKYHCLMGLSGGCDSSYMLHLVVRHMKLNPLVIHFDNGWNIPEANENIMNMVNYLSVDFIRFHPDIQEYDRLCKAFLMASVPDADIPNDVAMLSIFMDVAKKYDIKYVFNGHNFRNEGTCPTDWTWMDGKYIHSVYEWYWSKYKLRNYPSYTFWDQIKWALSGLKQFRPLYHLAPDKGPVKEMLKNEYGWKDYGEHHHENIYTFFVSDYLLLDKFGIDKRLIELSALIRSGLTTREKAKETLAQPVTYDPGLPEMIKKRLGMSSAEWQRMMADPLRDRKLFATYKDTFKRFKWLLWLLMKAHRLLRMKPEQGHKHLCLFRCQWSLLLHKRHVPNILLTLTR